LTEWGICLYHTVLRTNNRVTDCCYRPHPMGKECPERGTLEVRAALEILIGLTAADALLVKGTHFLEIV
jgi:hypothetical protein